MKKLLLLLAIWATGSNLFAQQMELAAGMNRNYFSSSREEPDLSDAVFTPGNGFAVRFLIKDFNNRSLPLSLFVGMEKYTGQVSTYYELQSGDGGLEGKIDRTNFEIGVFPINLSIGDNFKILAGGLISFLVTDRSSGASYSNWFDGNEYQNSSTPINDPAFEIHRPFNFGLSCRLGYEIEFSRDWYLVPQYQLYWGMSDEFERIAAHTSIRSMRHFVGFGISKKL